MVVAVRNLDAASKLYESLGFTLTPLARHPFGTSNRLVQFKTSFIELVAVSQVELINETTDVDFSFGAYNRDFLTKREGMSMVAMKSTDWKLDRYEFQSAGLELMAPFSFKRMAKQPNGVEVEVGFDLTYLPRLGAPDAMFFTCCHRHAPEHFYKSDYQVHVNGAKAIHSVQTESSDVVGTSGFLSAIDAEQKLFNVIEASGPNFERFAGFTVVVSNRSLLTAHLMERGLGFKENAKEQIILQDDICGVEITFCEEE